MKAKTRKIVGILFIALPIVGFLSVMIFWPLIAGLIVSFGTPETIVGLTPVVNLINVFLGVVGLISMIMIPVGFVAGLLMLLKKDQDVVAVNESQTPEVGVVAAEGSTEDGDIGNNV